MRVAIAGLGGAASRGHLPALAGLGGAVELVGAADPDEERRTALASSFPEATLFESAEEMLAQVEAEVLIIATEPRAHGGLVTAGMKRDLHVVCEKPLALTRKDQEAIAAVCMQRPQLALVPFHQYRYSPAWTPIRRWGRWAARRHLPYTLSVDVERQGPDRFAASPWRADLALSGGMIADAGVHFFALAWSLNERLERLAAMRLEDDAGCERSATLLRMGSGLLKLDVCNGAAERHTCLELQLGQATISVRDELAALRCGGLTLFRRRVPALSDRSHVDALYSPLYRDLTSNLDNAAWRVRRTAEALGVGELLVSLLEQTPLDTVAT